MHKEHLVGPAKACQLDWQHTNHPLCPPSKIFSRMMALALQYHLRANFPRIATNEGRAVHPLSTPALQEGRQIQSTVLHMSRTWWCHLAGWAVMELQEGTRMLSVKCSGVCAPCELLCASFMSAHGVPFLPSPTYALSVAKEQFGGDGHCS